MGDPYDVTEDLRRLISSSRITHSSHLPLPPPEPPLCTLNNTTTVLLPPPPPYDPTLMVADVFFSSHHHYSSTFINPTTNITTTTTVAPPSTALCNTIDTPEKGCWLGFDSGNNRWPRQETLSLLEIRSRLDSKFRENNHKAPLWNEVSRIMADEFGYQRSGKKCKEKFENLYKYYKKTKEGKGNRQDGKHYRFFRQLEAICGGAGGDHHHHQSKNINITNTTCSSSIHHHQIPTTNQDHQKYSESLSVSNTSSSSENNNDIEDDLSAMVAMKQKGVRKSRSWRAKVEEVVESHMRKIMETQDAWMGRMLSVVEQREEEMVKKEEERKKKESMRFDEELHELWAKERAWVEARDAALVEVVRKHVGVELQGLEALKLVEKGKKKKGNEEELRSSSSWTEMEISNLIEIKCGGYDEERVMSWDEVAGKMRCLGYERSGSECREMWDEISMSMRDEKTNMPWCLGLKMTDHDV